MTSPKEWGVNINTYIVVLGFLGTIGAGFGTYTSFRTETAIQINDLKAQRTEDVSQMRQRMNELSASVMTLMVQDARQIEQINAMLASLQRIERNVDTLVKSDKGP